MKTLTMLGVTAVVATTLSAFAAASASATTLEINGVTQNQPVTFTMSLGSGDSATLRTTSTMFLNTCSVSHVHGASTSPYTGTRVTEPLSTLTFTSCVNGPVTVTAPGHLNTEHIAGTTYGTMRSEGTEVKVPSPFGILTCKTGAGTDIGTLTGKKEG